MNRPSRSNRQWWNARCIARKCGSRVDKSGGGEIPSRTDWRGKIPQHDKKIYIQIQHSFYQHYEWVNSAWNDHSFVSFSSIYANEPASQPASHYRLIRPGSHPAPPNYFKWPAESSWSTDQWARGQGVETRARPRPMSQGKLMTC